MDSNMLTLKWETHKISYLKVLSQIRQSAAFSDATIACDGKFYNVHKLVMSSCSDYLRTLFENVDMCGSQIAHPVIILHGVTHQHMEAFLDYVYLGKVNILQTELASLLKAAKILQIKGLAIPDTCSFEKVEDEQDSFKFKHLAIPDTCRFEKVEDELDSFKFKHQIECFKSDIENQGEEKEASFPTKSISIEENMSFDYPDNRSVKQESPDNKIKESELKGCINENISHPDNHSIISEQENSSSSKYHEQENNCDSAEPHSSNVDSNIQYDENMNNKTPPKHDDGESNFSPGGPIEAIDLWLLLKSYKGRTYGVKCPLCPKLCVNKGAFLTHYKIHTGDKPYACPHCPRRFVQRVKQLKHIKTPLLQGNLNALCAVEDLVRKIILKIILLLIQEKKF